MKIRIRGNSLRFRLTKSEVTKLADEKYLQERTEFTGKRLLYAIIATAHDQLSAEYDGESITLYMPEQMILEWVTTDRVGFDDNTGPVTLLIEKDFTCLDNVEEDQSDNFPNPHS